MSFQVDRGLFRLDFTDHHAVLGVSVDSETKDIRKRYLKIARRLHPDSFVSEGEQDKAHASELLSKLVNPAWEQLSQERERTEYDLLLKLKGQQALRQKDAIELGSNLAKQLSTASNPDHFYVSSLKDLANKQYEQLDQALEITAQISELNLVYLMRKEGTGGIAIGEPKKTIFTGSNIPDSSQSSTSLAAQAQAAANNQPKPETVADQFYRRSEGYLAKNNFAQAILELREALQIEPNNSRCHSLMGMIYLKQNQATMAKIHFNQALKFNPQEPTALEGLQKLGQAQTSTAKATGKAATNAKSAAQKTTSKAKPNDKSSGGGLFGLFGGKKK
jgi:curved DNA-binding protein CbpA